MFYVPNSKLPSAGSFWHFFFSSTVVLTSTERESGAGRVKERPNRRKDSIKNVFLKKRQQNTFKADDSPCSPHPEKH